MSGDIPCNWCGSTKNPLCPSKKFCITCMENCVFECKKCHKPFPAQRFLSSEIDTCKSCYKKLLKLKGRSVRDKRMCETVATYFEKKMLQDEKHHFESSKPTTLYQEIQKSKVIPTKQPRKCHVK